MSKITVKSGKEIGIGTTCAAKEIVCAAEEFSSVLRLITGDGAVQCSEKTENIALMITFALFEEINPLDFGNQKIKVYEKELRGTDGFAVLREKDRLYILSHRPSGVYYGAQDFLEKNFGVIFARGATEYATEFVPKKEWTINLCDYMEKSPFSIRTWNMCGVGSERKAHSDSGTAVYYGKNKMNGIFHHAEPEWFAHGVYGCGVVMPVNNIDDLIDEHPEYFMVDSDHKPKRSKHESFINYYNAEAAKAAADRIIDFLSAADDRNLYIWMMPDDPYFCMEEGGICLSDEPFTADDGITVTPEDADYKSTVYFNFMNRVIRRVNASRPNTQILTFAYLYSEQAPATKIDDNLFVSLAPIYTNEKYAYTDRQCNANLLIAENIEKWSKMSSRLCIYSYWNSFKGDIYMRPILRQIKKDLLWFEQLGVCGITAEGKTDCSLVTDMTEAQNNSRRFFDLNEACAWVITKLIWNPREDVDELLRRYATVVYKETAEDFLRCYYLIERGFNSADAYVWYPTGGDVYILQFIIEAGIKDELLKILKDARRKAETESVQLRWKSIGETLEREIDKYASFIKEECKVLVVKKDEDICSPEALDYKNNIDSVWNKAIPMRILRNYETMADYAKEANFECRMLFNGESIFIGYCVCDDKIESSFTNDSGVLRIRREDGSYVESYAETYIGGNELNQSVYFGYISGFTASGKGQFYKNEGLPKSTTAEGLRDYYFAKTSSRKDERYYFHVQEIPLSALNVKKEDFKPYGSFVYYTDRFKRGGWMGFGLWCKQNFQTFVLENNEKIVLS